MATDGEPKAAVPGVLRTVQADDPQAMHDLTVVLHCASEAAAYGIMMDLASKMYLQCNGLDDLPEGRSLPVAGTVIEMLTRGPTAQKLGHAVVTMVED